MNTAHASRCNGERERENVNAELGNEMEFSKRMKGFSCPSSFSAFGELKCRQMDF